MRTPKGLLRRNIPKDTDLGLYDPDDLDAVAASLNRRPRKTLESRPPAEARDAVNENPETDYVATSG